jgi:hypothetical protein
MIRLHNCLIGLRGLTGDVQDTLMALGTQTLKVSQHVRTLVFAAAKTTPGLRLTAQRLAAPSTRGLSTETTASAPSAQPSPTPERPNSPLTERTPERPAEEAA